MDRQAAVISFLALSIIAIVLLLCLAAWGAAVQYGLVMITPRPGFP